MVDSSTSLETLLAAASSSIGLQLSPSRTRGAIERDAILESSETRAKFLRDLKELRNAAKIVNIDSLQRFTGKYPGITSTIGKTITSAEGDIISESKLTSLAAFAAFRDKETMLQVKKGAEKLFMYQEAVKQAPTKKAKAQIPLPDLDLPKDLIKLLTDPEHFINHLGTILDILNRIKEEEIRLSLTEDGAFSSTDNLKQLLMIGKILGSEELTTLNLSTATRVNCSGCTGLTQLTAPNAREVICYRCIGLTQLDVPNATIVNCYRCSSLTQLNILNATKVNCSNCASLRQLTAPSAITLDCDGCTGLPRSAIETLRRVFSNSCCALV